MTAFLDSVQPPDFSYLPEVSKNLFDVLSAFSGITGLCIFRAAAFSLLPESSKRRLRRIRAARKITPFSVRRCRLSRRGKA